MQVLRVITSFLSLAAMLVTFSRPALAGERSWVLNQTNSVYGKRDVYISPSGAVKMVFKEQGYCLVSSGPVWQPIIFNEKRRLWHALDLKTYERRAAYMYSFAENFKDDLWQKGKTVTVDGCRAQSYDYQVPRGADITAAQYCEASDIKVAPRAAEVLRKLYRVPIKDAPLLEIGYKDRLGRAKSILSTQKIARVLTGQDFYKCPPGFRPCSDYMQVAAADGDAAEIIDGISAGLGHEPIGQKKR